MRFAVLAPDEYALELARAVAMDARHELTAFCEAETHQSELASLAPRATWLESWEPLVHGALADAVIVGADPFTEERTEQLRKIASAGIALLAAHPACEAIAAIELEMIQQDTQATLAAYHPAARHPAVRRLAQIAEDAANSGVGQVEQLILERSAERRQGREALTWLARDASLVRLLLGEIDKVSAVGASGGEESTVDQDRLWANASVSFVGSQGAVGRWSLLPAGGAPGLRLTLIGTEGKASLWLSEDLAAARLETPGEAARDFTWRRDEAARQEIIDFTRDDSPSRTGESWRDARRALESVEAAERSMRRGRAIDLYDEPHSEAENFKGIMAAAGCGLLLVSLLVLFGGAALDAVIAPFRASAPSGAALERPAADAPPRTSLWLRLWPAYPLLLFLALQLLRWIARDAPQAKRADGAPPEAPKATKDKP